MELEVLEALEALEVLEVLEVIEAVMEAMESIAIPRPSMAREMPMLLGIVMEVIEAVMEAIESITIVSPSAMSGEMLIIPNIIKCSITIPRQVIKHYLIAD